MGARAGAVLTAAASFSEAFEVVVVQDERRLFRVCGPSVSEAFDLAFRSNYEQHRPARGPERRATALHMGLSMFETLVVADSLARRVPKLGGHVAEVRLVGDRGICVADTFGVAHWTVWGRPQTLADCVVRVVRAGR